MSQDLKATLVDKSNHCAVPSFLPSFGSRNWLPLGYFFLLLCSYANFRMSFMKFPTKVSPALCLDPCASHEVWLADRRQVFYLNRLASRSHSSKHKMSPSRTGPFTFRIMERFGSSMNSTRTRVTLPVFPVRPSTRLICGGVLTYPVDGICYTALFNGPQPCRSPNFNLAAYT